MISPLVTDPLPEAYGADAQEIRERECDMNGHGPIFRWALAGREITTCRSCGRNVRTSSKP